MKAIFQRLAIIAVFLSGNLAAQDLVGTWQGTLTRASRDFRIAIQISQDGGTLHGLLLNVDQGGAGVPSAPIRRQGSSLTITMPGIGVTYCPVLSSDGRTMSGPWKQDATSLVLTLQHVTAEAAWPVAPGEAIIRPAPMPAAADPRFEVASIKLSRPDGPPKNINVLGRRFLVIDYSLTDLMTFAYAVHQNQIAGGPAWRSADRFDISAAQEGDGQPNLDQFRKMVAGLLTERFHLAFHRGKKELPVYAITALNTGVKLTPAGDPVGYPTFGYRALGSLEARRANMDDFAKNIQRIFLDRPVIDRTGLTGKYDFALTWKPDEFQFANFGTKLPPAPPDGDTRPDLFTAFRQQLGLKLESTKAKIEVLVVDRAEKPSEN